MTPPLNQTEFSKRAWTSIRMGFMRSLIAVSSSMVLQGCYLYEFFKRDPHGANESLEELGRAGVVLGQSLGEKASGYDPVLMAEVRAVGMKVAPALVRPDPDKVLKNLFLEHRAPGVTLARQAGQFEPFRMLLGGASEDFSKPPQEIYDATSLLALLKAGEGVCKSLVAPNEWEHAGWSTILPYPASDHRGNIRFLAQRLTGRPIEDFTPLQEESLVQLLELEEAAIKGEWWAQSQPYSKYIGVCNTLLLDAMSLYL